MAKYEELDAEIIERVRGGENRFNGIAQPKVRSLAKDLKFTPLADSARQLSIYHPSVDRLIDRRLQTLKKVGKLTFTPKLGWRVTTPAIDIPTLTPDAATA